MKILRFLKNIGSDGPAANEILGGFRARVQQNRQYVKVLVLVEGHVACFQENFQLFLLKKW